MVMGPNGHEDNELGVLRFSLLHDLFIQPSSQSALV